MTKNVMKSYISRHEMPCFGGEENQHVLVRGVKEEALSKTIEIQFSD